MTTQYASTDYDDLTLPERCDAMAEARDMARDDIDQHQTGIIPFAVGDPRRDAYLSVIEGRER